jgi:uracil phosphoribosyltransferase
VPLHVVDHPVVHDALTTLRDVSTPPPVFRRVAVRISLLLAAEATRDLPVHAVTVQTPLGPAAGRRAGADVVVVPVLRAGLGMLDGMLALLPAARVAHVGIYRNPTTLEAVEYYFKAPADVAERMVLVLDPMLATANSAVAAVERFKARGCRQIRFVCLLAAPEGLRHFHAAHPDVPVWTAAVDRALDDHGYIRPGLGDAGDRIFGTV